MTATHVKISGVLELSGALSKDRLRPGWQYICSFHPPVRLKMTHVVLKGCLKSRPDIHVLITLKGISGRYREMIVSLRSNKELSKMTCGAWISGTLIPFITTSPDEFEDKVLDLITPDCDPRDRKADN
jgi:hypothetical protein